MKFSIITPSFNQADYLERTLESIHSQQGDFELEHIVMDGGSTDGSVAILERWADKLDFVSEKDEGQSDALNKGFAKATGDVVAWLNSDDVYKPGALDAVARYFDERPETDWLCGQCVIIDEHDAEIRRGITAYKNFWLRRYSYSALLVENFISQPATFFRRDLLEQVGPIDKTLYYAMDYDLWLRFARVSEPGILQRDLAAFRFYTAAKTGGAFKKSLWEAHTISRRHARQSGRPFLAFLNYWIYYQRTNLAYKLLSK
ncbi:MAG: glycosyltransferase [Deltaproteobacteria bacterium]|nr:glycosyltransferase [bacterium]MCB9476483.1 glycosyltransferase [Deltaproteobacteria bacterium]MCB9478904.1 glycosyltransferase [Deltaproteobacteria bacterium]MCB9489410.1 glycosyltransferase [Deltaproteobacteria bacterium]